MEADKSYLKVAFFVREGLDSFIDDVISYTDKFYMTKKIIVKDYKEIDEGLKWGDVCFFEWCDELIAYASSRPISSTKKIICRIHSYEVFSNYPSCVNWDIVDKIIFVARHIRDIAVKKFNIDINKTVIIPNGIDTEKYAYAERKPGFNIAYAGYINYKKGPMLLLHTFDAIHRSDNRYNLYIAGQFQDERYALYYRQMISEMNLSGCVHFDGWQNDLDKWLDDKNYILCTSLLESQNISVMEAMSKGIKPVIHNFVGAENIYPSEYLFNTIPDAVKMINTDYDSRKYREYILNNFDIKNTNVLVKNEIDNIMGCISPLVSIVMTVYNREKFVGGAVKSVLNQSYKNIELIIVNDGSKDDSEKIIKSIDDKRIRYYYKENTGQLDSLKFGLEKASGDYITRVDSDDIIESDFVSECLNEINKDKSTEFVYTDFKTIDSEGNVTGETHFKDYSNPADIIIDDYNNFTSVIPDVAFWKKDYIPFVISNYAEGNMPFYIDNILYTSFSHVKNTLYRYRKHESNFASDNKNIVKVVEGKIKFIDFIIRRYFIQLDINKDFSQNRETYYKKFTLKYICMAELYNDVESLYDKFINEAYYWLKKQKSNEEFKKILPLPVNKIYSSKNTRIMIVSADDPMMGKFIGGKHAHIYMLQKGLKSLNVFNRLVTYNYDKNASINVSNMIEDFNINNQDIIHSDDIQFLILIYIMQKQMENKIINELKRSYISCISCQDVIAVHAAEGALKALSFDIPVILTVHGYFTYENTDYGLMKKGSPVYNYFLDYERRAYDESEKIAAVDTNIKNYICSMKSKDKSNVLVIKNAVDDTVFSPMFSDNDAFNNNIFLVPRRLVPKCGVINAVKAAKIVIEKGYTNFLILIAGDGIEKNTIIDYVKENNIEKNIKLAGRVPHNEINKYYNSAKAVIIPSIESENVKEATSIAALEGMSCGKIVIASDLGGLSEIIKNDITGLLVKPGNVQMLADAIIKVILIDNKKYVDMGNNARQSISSNYGFMDHAKKFLEIFNDESI